MTNDDEREHAEVTIKSYRQRYNTYERIPAASRRRDAILAEMEEIASLEEDRWHDGFASGSVYHGDQDHVDFLSKVYTINSQANPLHTDIWPSVVKYESEIVSMTASMLGADESGAERWTPAEVCGTLSSGGTESSILVTGLARRRESWNRT